MSARVGVRRVLIIDDHPIVRHGLGQLIGQEPDLSVVGAAADAAAARAAVRELDPDVVTVDISLGGGDGLDLIRDIRSIAPALPILVVSIHQESLYAERALRAGAQGYVMKQEAIDVIIGALRRVLEGKVFVSEPIAERVIGRLVAGRSAPSESPVAQLSDRELQVFQAIGRGLGTRETAAALHISAKTVESHRASIKEKLGLRSAGELLIRAARWVEESS